MGGSGPPPGPAPLRVARAGPAGRPGVRRSSWSSQATVVFGGHDYVQRTTGHHLRRVRPPGLRAAHRGHGAHPAGGVGGRPQGRPRDRRGPRLAARCAGCPVRADPGRRGRPRSTGCRSTRMPTASPGCGCWWTSSRAGSAFWSWPCWWPGSGSRHRGSPGWRCSPGRRRWPGWRWPTPMPGSPGTTWSASRRPADRLVVPRRALRGRRPGRAGRCPQNSCACAVPGCWTADDRLAVVEPGPSPRRDRARGRRRCPPRGAVAPAATDNRFATGQRQFLHLARTPHARAVREGTHVRPELRLRPGRGDAAARRPGRGDARRGAGRGGDRGRPGRAEGGQAGPRRRPVAAGTGQPRDRRAAAPGPQGGRAAGGPGPGRRQPGARRPPERPRGRGRGADAGRGDRRRHAAGRPRAPRRPAPDHDRIRADRRRVRRDGLGGGRGPGGRGRVAELRRPQPGS